MNASSPFFSWTCLFPADTSYEFAPHTAWAREAGGSRARGDVFVTSDRSSAALPDLDSYGGLVAVNCQGLSERRLQEAGFAYVRRFALLPGLESPRWFIPLETPALSSAGFCLSAPFKFAAQLRRCAGRAAARVGLPGWYRDQIIIARREVPPVERAIQELFPGRPVRLALSSGTPPPAINRKISLAVLAAGGQVLAFGKLPGPSGISEHNVRREAEVLSHLSRCPGGTRAPRLLFSGSVGGRFLALSTPLPGRPPGPEPADAHRRFLDGLRTGRLRPADDNAYARSLWERAPLLANRPDLATAHRDLLSALRASRLPATTVHGDFVPWNLREHEGAIGAFDWEYAQVDGLPLIDETHHLLAVGYLLRNWSPAEAFDRLSNAASDSPLDLPPRVVGLLQLGYLLDYLLRLFGEGHGDDYPRVKWCRDIVHYLAPPALRGVAA